MTPDGSHDFMLLNQTLVRFSSGSLESVAYSNTVQTPLVGPLFTIRLEAAPERLVRGQIAMFTVTIRNSGNLGAFATVFVALPEGLSFIPNSVLRDGASMPGATPSVGIPLGQVPVGSVIRIVFQTMMVSIPASYVFECEALLSYRFTTYGGRVVTDEATSNTATLEAVPYQLFAHGQLSSPVTFVGDILAYEITLRNEGQLTLTQLLVHFRLPEDFRFVSRSVALNGVLAPWIVPDQGAPVSALRPGETMSVRVGVYLDAADPEYDTADFQSLIDYRAGGESLHLLTNVSPVIIVKPTVSVQLSVDRPHAQTGQTLTYEAIVSNDSKFALDGVLTELIPAGTTFVSGSVVVDGVPRLGFSLAEGLPLGTLLAQSRAVVAYRVTIDQPAVPVDPRPIENSVRFIYTCRLTDGRAISQQVRSNTVHTDLLALRLTVTASAHPMEFGLKESVDYAAIVKNNGNASVFANLLRSPYPLGFHIHDVKIDGRRVPDFPLESGLELGLVQTGGSVRVTYAVYRSAASAEMLETAKTLALNRSADDADDSDYVTTRYIANYYLTYGGTRYVGTSRSNELLIPIEDDSE
ncbi:hypothetical protein [Cohnella sp. GCM10027633]|uniref:hypothetical protein n=1 Tax=unclassified Cohnella TaxID=2636738 RepID=UPI0036452C34